MELIEVMKDKEKFLKTCCDCEHSNIKAPKWDTICKITKKTKEWYDTCENFKKKEVM